MADGAIGYLENEEENLKIFQVVSKALKQDGKHFMDIMNGGYAEAHFPCKLWDAGEKGLILSNFEWDAKKKTLVYGQVDYPYGEALYEPDMQEGNPIRLYTQEEIEAIFAELNMNVFDCHTGFGGTPASDHHSQLMMCSQKQ